MSQETIDIEIAGRSYPLTVSPEEVEGIKNAAAAVDERIVNLKSQFAVQDRIDLLAMAALQLSLRIKELENDNGDDIVSHVKSPEDTEEEIILAASVDDLLQRLETAMQG
jgi:cell division protein ZapA (FtsZ GTPase activity inhibitor)